MSPAASDPYPSDPHPSDGADQGRTDPVLPAPPYRPFPTEAGSSGFRPAEEGAYHGSLPPVLDRPARGRLRRTVAVLAAALLGTSLLGVPLGLLWAALADRVPMVKVEGGAYPAQSQPEGFVAADGWFSLLALGFGVLAAAAGWFLLRRYRGPLGMAVIVLGSLGAAILAWRVGREIGLAGYQHLLETAPVGKVINRPPDLRAGGVGRWHGIPFIRGNLLLSAFGAAVAYTLLAGWSRYPGLRSEPEPVGPAAPGWGSASDRPARSATPG